MGHKTGDTKVDKQADLRNVWILSVERLNNSVNGNPRFDITFTDNDGEFVTNQWTHRTSSDSSCNYEVTNYANSGERIDVWLTKAGRVYMMRPVS
jgi:hypothetical protein